MSKFESIIVAAKQEEISKAEVEIKLRDEMNFGPIEAKEEAERLIQAEE